MHVRRIVKHSRGRAPFAFGIYAVRRLAPRPGYRAAKSVGEDSIPEPRSPARALGIKHMARTCARVCVAPDVAPRNLYAGRSVARSPRSVPATSAKQHRPFSRSLILSHSPSRILFIALAAERSAFRTKRHWNRVSCFYSRNNNGEFMRDRSSGCRHRGSDAGGTDNR